MIKVRIVRDAGNDAIISFTVTGHAYYGEPGHDIVCAGVSAVAAGTVNSIERLTGHAPRVVSKSGLLKADRLLVPDDATNSRIQLLLEAMAVSLMSIEESYGKYMRVNITTGKEGG